jgi:hypothetical protein
MRLLPNPTPGDLLIPISTWWNDDLERTLSFVGRSNHAYISYDMIIVDPKAVIEPLAALLGVPFDRRMLAPGSQARSIVGWRNTYPHMQAALGPVTAAIQDKFQTLDRASQAVLEARLTNRGDVTSLALPFVGQRSD